MNGEEKYKKKKCRMPSCLSQNDSVSQTIDKIDLNPFKSGKEMFGSFSALIVGGESTKSTKESEKREYHLTDKVKQNKRGKEKIIVGKAVSQRKPCDQDDCLVFGSLFLQHTCYGGLLAQILLSRIDNISMEESKMNVILTENTQNEA
eukprot:TRINITY_DN1336_c0_g1_i4.p1 TRINITY_DN1336_c0_g1~~TRINITY_DN1336_c0_g1_i4.p1  ORF type:complete len:148 (-),score=36.49 TRINITY_DN1336_c0_g1_i4:2175-2618(-)